MRRRLLAVAMLVLVAGCREEGAGSASLAVHFVVPAPPSPDPFDGLVSFRVTLERASDGVAIASADFGANEALSLELPVRNGVRLALAGFDGAGAVIARGRTSPFNLTEAGGEVWMYFSRVGTLEEVAGTWTPRSAPSVAQLSDGRVLIAGGLSGTTPSTKADLFDPETNALVAAPDLPEGHGFPVAVSLAADTVLLAGGVDASGDAVDLAHVFDYDSATRTGTWIADPMSTARRDHAGASLGGGRAILVGGTNGSGLLSSSEIYEWDGSSGSWTSGNGYSDPVKALFGVAVEDGKAIFGGGWTTEDGPRYLKKSYLYSWSSGGGSFADLTDLRRERGWASVLPVSAGAWLLVGGLGGGGGNPSPSTELLTWDGTAATHTDRANVTTPRRRGGGGLLSDGRVLVVGGDTSTGSQSSPLDEALLFDPAGNTMTPAADSPGACVTSSVVTLPDLTALVVCDDRVVRLNP